MTSTSDGEVGYCLFILALLFLEKIRAILLFHEPLWKRQVADRCNMRLGLLFSRLFDLKLYSRLLKGKDHRTKIIAMIKIIAVSSYYEYF